nr:immunoglobulin light chain junction region [Macaca mulatta]MPN87321.1 immunoglobulin light chain junction region [Macaca mulatta]MPN87397.1 immunoglobulin light chain junction region [Macaca mulatta]MPN88159.1 immunoglobulin light chain junction region [Macaca mulatta]MPN88311.1 immunoglobulin light chain junction region [Macaca mulatta]
CMQGIQFPLTV